MNPILIGPAGWSYTDWDGVFYPAKRPKDFSPLEYVSRYFPIVEVNVTFYRLPELSMVCNWLQKVERKDFKFCIKAWQGFTHQSVTSGHEAARFSSILQAIADRQRLAAVLFQFPWSVKRSPENITRLQRLLTTFFPFPCAVEFRHGSWQNAKVFALLREFSAAFVNIDQPVIGDSIKPSAEVTAPFAYVRLHGRNRADWFRREAGRDDRYNYLYSAEELGAWADKIKSMAENAPTIVIFNNHFRGQATLNAFQLMYRLFEKSPLVPAPLKENFPEELSFAISDSPQFF